MKTKFALLIFCFCILSSAFSQKIVSLRSLFTEQDAVLVPGMEGSWEITDFDMIVSINKAGDNFYLLKYGSEKNESAFEAVFLKIKDEIFLDLSGIIPDSVGDEGYRSSFVKCHSFYKVLMTKDTLQLSELNYSWFYDYTMKKKLPLSYEWIDNTMLLTLKTAELKSFISEHNKEKDIFKNSVTLVSKHTNVFEKTIANQNYSEYKSLITTYQNCKPEFPLQDGWLGGDGDVSVSISSILTLFIFSDTYVGNKGQQSRKEAGLKMVSNTVAVETCLSAGKTVVQYFWNNMYSENPLPIFKTFTNRYRFWVNDAFMVNNYLYVLLAKIGAKQGAPPDDIFNFSQLGYTLAKISNPRESPDKWKIELIPVPDFGNPDMGLGSHVLQGNYIYLFLNYNRDAQFLIRKKIDFIDNPEKPFEYYALDKTWKGGIKTDDMDTIVTGFRCNTVNYHPEMKQWVMICDIKFMDNKINMRTAPELTGPWSDEKILYEIPEVTPGNSSYSKSNFCYLARECIQNYDSKKHVMLITYDINNSNFSEINSNLKIYTPKIITIPLQKYGSR